VSHRTSGALAASTMCAFAAMAAACGTSSSRPVGGADAGFAGACGQPLVWSRVPGSPPGFRITGSGPTDIWLIANTFDGGGAAVAPCMPNTGDTVACSGALMRGDATTWANVVDLQIAGETFPAWQNAGSVWVGGRDDAFVGESAMTTFRWDGARWTELRAQANRAVDWLWGSGPNDVWGTSISGDFLGHWDGSAWVAVAPNGGGGVLAGAAPGDWWVFGFGEPGVGTAGPFAFDHHQPAQVACSADAGATYCCVLPDGTTGCGSFHGPVGTSAEECSPAKDSEALSSAVSAGWASDTNDVWFVGLHAFHYDGARWTCAHIPSNAYLQGVWGSSRTDVWAVGNAGTILHFDGATWTSVSSPTTSNLYSVWTSGPCDVWAIGDAVYHAQPVGGGGGSDGSGE
jgi:hypothetical protein